MSEPNASSNPDVQFEKEDIRATPVLKFLVGIAVTSVVTCFLLLALAAAACTSPAPAAVRRPPAERPPDAVLGSGGTGLAGLRERVLMAGGTLRTGPTPDGGFELEARW